MAAPRMLVVFSSAALVVAVAFAIAVVIGEWWILPVALLVHLGATGLVLAFLGRRILEDRDKPDPVTEARLEEERAEESQNGSRRPEEERGVFGL
jgi:membrane protein implicated in regulation of membrane protease activity